jgi:hypothetical protein
VITCTLYFSFISKHQAALSLSTAISPGVLSFFSTLLSTFDAKIFLYSESVSM